MKHSFNNNIMKNLLSIFAILAGLTSIAQTAGDTTRFKVGTIEFIIIDNDTIPVEEYEYGSEEWKDMDEEDKPDLSYWSGFDLGVNMLMNDDFKSDFSDEHLNCDPSQSFSYSFNFLEQRIRIIKDYFGIVTGIGFTNSRYGFDSDHLRLMANADSTWGMYDSTLTTGFTKNQLRVNYFNVPVLFQINTSKLEDKNFHIAFGAIGGIRMSSKVKYVYDAFGGENDHKEKGRYNLNPFQLCATARIGYRDFGLFVNYNILSLYENGKSPNAYPLTFGASFHF